MGSRLESLRDVPVFTRLSISRVRGVTDPSLPTTGHLLSHSVEELREELSGSDMSNALLLDDTSFSGSTNLLAAKLLERAHGDKPLNLQHGFLILNEGDLGTLPGARQRLGRAVGGLAMHTPRQDGWHFFDMVRQKNLPDHLEAALHLVSLQEPAAITEFFAHDENVSVLFPERMHLDELRMQARSGKFIGPKEIEGEFHTANPQLLPSIISSGHIRPPEAWCPDTEALLCLLRKIGAAVTGESHE